MRIPLDRLAGGEGTYRHRSPISQYLDNTDFFTGEIALRAELHREGGMLHIELSFDLPGQFTCDRCGQPFARQHAGKDEFYFTFAEAAGGRNDPDATIIPRGAVEIDVSQEIRDLVILSLPFQLICSPECRGLCPSCGADLNAEECHCQGTLVDPRWEALKKLK